MPLRPGRARSARIVRTGTKPWYHHRTTVGHVRYCITSGRVDINQTDHEGRTLLYRLVRDLGDDSESFRVEIGEGQWWYSTTASRKERRGMVEELLRWDQLNLDAVGS